MDDILVNNVDKPQVEINMGDDLLIEMLKVHAQTPFGFTGLPGYYEYQTPLPLQSGNDEQGKWELQSIDGKLHINAPDDKKLTSDIHATIKKVTSMSENNLNDIVWKSEIVIDDAEMAKFLKDNSNNTGLPTSLESQHCFTVKGPKGTNKDCFTEFINWELSDEGNKITYSEKITSPTHSALVKEESIAK